MLLLVSLYFSFASARHEVEEVYDARLGQSAKLLLMTTSVSSDEFTQANHRKQFERWMENIQSLSEADSDIATAFGHPYEQNIIFQFYRDQTMLWSSDKTLPPFAKDPLYSGFGDINVNNNVWRFFQLAQPDEKSLTEYVIVAEKQSIRKEVIDDITLSTALPQLILIPSLLVVMILLIDRHFRPISELKLAIEQRSVHNLDRITVSNQTVELSPLVDALNTLLALLEKAWQREKRFTHMAAHELKTPLTILRLNAENALNSKNQMQLEQDLGNILKGIDRTDRLIHQLLMLAKVESIMVLEKNSVDVSEVVKQAIADLVPLALRNHQQLSFEGESYFLEGDEFLLEILFRNLIDNAIRYSGENSRIEVSVMRRDDYLEIIISDSGDDISNEVRDKLFDNFYRANTEKGDGAGLGMSITRYIATLHGASIELLPRTEEKNTFRIQFPI